MARPCHRRRIRHGARSTAISTVPHVALNNGVEIPLLGFRVFQISPQDTERALTRALETGYRSIDTAAVRQNEEAVGRAPSPAAASRAMSCASRRSCGSPGRRRRPAGRAFETSLSRLGLDLCLIHQPYGDYCGTWRALEAAYQQGSARAGCAG
ncbi:aldo/keto reductase [Streptomyces sp. 8L]|uniref:aldo/keto reductase n=1 Tax=Streptomyces sp. 8L TaxID=2877242 RepID=UPI001CD599C5|nr:aldo/keto reductase [Streptomyces sp. 8L]MCA1222980.1 aldo/keto reductase [Streptomyces sp. 8L]